MKKAQEKTNSHRTTRRAPRTDPALTYAVLAECRNTSVQHAVKLWGPWVRAFYWRCTKGAVNKGDLQLVRHLVGRPVADIAKHIGEHHEYVDACLIRLGKHPVAAEWQATAKGKRQLRGVG